MLNTLCLLLMDFFYSWVRYNMLQLYLVLHLRSIVMPFFFVTIHWLTIINISFCHFTSILLSSSVAYLSLCHCFPVFLPFITSVFVCTCVCVRVRVDACACMSDCLCVRACLVFRLRSPFA